MERSEVDQLCEELDRLIQDGPGVDSAGLGRVRLIASMFEAASDHSYVRAQAQNLVRDFELWFSPRKWQRWGKGGAKLRSLLSQDVHKLRGAMVTYELTDAP